jgi:hypothetical protein
MLWMLATPSVVARLSVRLWPPCHVVASVDSASGLPPNSPPGRENPVSRTGSTSETTLQLDGEGGIRTPGALASTTVFETAAFNRSATSPYGASGEVIPGRLAQRIRDCNRCNARVAGRPGLARVSQCETEVAVPRDVRTARLRSWASLSSASPSTRST